MYKLTQLWWGFHFWFVKWFILKPLVKLNNIVNGRFLSQFTKKKWYNMPFKSPCRCKWLNTTSYKLTKYVIFK